jgi:hypothetical protein
MFNSGLSVNDRKIFVAADGGFVGKIKHEAFS